MPPAFLYPESVEQCLYFGKKAVGSHRDWFVQSKTAGSQLSARVWLSSERVALEQGDKYSPCIVCGLKDS